MILWMTAVARADDFDDKTVALDAAIATTHVGDAAWDVFSDADALPAYGFRVGVRPAPRVAVHLGWGAVRKGSVVTADGFSAGSVAAATAHQWTLGVRGDLSVGDVFRPSIGAAGVLMPMRWRFDGDPDHAGDATEVQVRGLPVGFEVTGGVELRLPPHEIVALAPWLELGGAAYARAAFGDVGTLRPGGFVARGGLGLRF